MPAKTDTRPSVAVHVRRVALIAAAVSMPADAMSTWAAIRLGVGREAHPWMARLFDAVGVELGLALGTTVALGLVAALAWITRPDADDSAGQVALLTAACVALAVWRAFVVLSNVSYLIGLR